MTREDFQRHEPGSVNLVTGELLNRHGRAGQSLSQGRGGQDAHSINTTIKTDAPEPALLQGVFVVREGPNDNCGFDQDANYFEAPCEKFREPGPVIGLYTGAFRYWDHTLNKWLEYPETVRLDTSGFFEGYNVGNAGDDGPYETWASFNARGQGYGQIPRLYPGEALTAYFDPQRGYAIPLVGSLPQDESFIEYIHRKDQEGPLRIPEHLTSASGERVVAQLRTTAPTEDGTEVVDKLYWRMVSDDCCSPCDEISGVSSTQNDDRASFLDSRSGFATIWIRHNDKIWIDVARTAEPTGNMYVDSATIRVTAVGRMNTAAQRSINRDFRVDTPTRDLAGWTRRSSGFGRHGDLPAYCPTGPDYACPDSSAYQTNGHEIYFALRDQNEEFLVRIDWKVVIEFIPDFGGLSTTSQVPEDSSASSNSSSGGMVTSSSSSQSQTTTSTSLSSSSTSSISSISSSSSSSVSSLSSSQSLSGVDTDIPP